MVYWGFEPDVCNNKNNKKRGYDDVQCGGKMDGKKIKLFKDHDKMIYAIKEEIHFTSDISAESMEALIKKITKIINREHEKYEGTADKLKITLILDSGGGSVNAVLKFIDFLKITKKKYPYVTFVSVLTGLCASATTVLGSSCDVRLMTKHAHAMIHSLSSGRSGMYTHLQSYSKFLTMLHNDLIDIYMEKCHKTREELEQLLLCETWYSAEEYKAAGFIDDIIDV